jgi:putative transposase
MIAVNDRHLTIAALDQALRSRSPEAGLLHSIRGARTRARATSHDRGVTCRMSVRGNCHDNAAMELAA